MRLVSAEEARRIAIRAQLLDGSATSILDTVQAVPPVPPAKREYGYHVPPILRAEQVPLP